MLHVPSSYENMTLLSMKLPCSSFKRNKGHLTLTQSLCDDPMMKIPLEIESIMSRFTVRIPTEAELNDKEQDFTTHLNMTSTTNWKPAEVDFTEKKAALTASLSSDYVMRHMQSRCLNPLQVRGQDWLTPSDSDQLEFAALLEAESMAADTGGSCQLCRREEMDELSRPIYSGVFANEHNLDFDLDKSHFD